MMKKFYFTAMLGLGLLATNAQEFSVDADFRTRLENGPNLQPATNGDKVYTTVFSRSRVNFNFKDEKFELKFSPQDLRQWNATASAQPAGAVSDDANVSTVGVADAWLKYHVSDDAYIQVGRQALDYDNNRLLGHLDWTMQGRFFEAFKYSRKMGENSKLDFVATYNNDGRNESGTVDFGQTTKSLQFLHYSAKPSDKFKFSLLALNNVVDGPNTDNMFATFGFNPHITLSDKLALYGSAYYQAGVNDEDKTLGAYEVSVNLDIKPSAKAKITLGTEILSGTDADETEDDNTFKPLYGTNHLHNGFMDYFYVGGAAGNVQGNSGLMDNYIKTTFKLSPKSILKIHGHYFSTAAETASDDKDLGGEIDLVFVRKIDKAFKLVLGHSQFFEGKLLENNINNDYQGWSWAMLVFKPQLFKTKI